MMAGAGMGGRGDLRKGNSIRANPGELLNKNHLDSWNEKKINDLLTLIVSDANYSEVQAIDNEM